MTGPKHTPTVLTGPCPGCNGEPYGEHWDAPYACPDCAGTGKAANSITANEKLRDAAPRLAAALKRTLAVLQASSEAQVLEEYGEVTARLTAVKHALDAARAALREAGYES